MSTDRYRFGDFTLDLPRASLLRGGESVALRPKSFDLLRYFVERPGRIVGKDELMSALWRDVVVTDDSLLRCISEVRAALGDGAQHLIKTVPRRGYLFDVPVQPLPAASAAGGDAVAAASPADLPPSGAAPRGRPRRRALPLLMGLAAVLLVVAAAWRMLVPGAGAVPPRLSLVVLPFADLGTDRSQAYLADVLTDDLTSALARLRGVTVIAASSAFRYKGLPPELPRLGTELQVRYAVQGSVLRSGERVRVSASLRETGSGRSLWSDQFDVERGELPKTQDHIVARLANALDAELIQADSRRIAGATPANLDAEDLAMQCEAAAGLQQGESGAPSYELCERALQLDPRNVRALVRLAIYHGDRVERVQSADRQADLARARGWVDRALAVDARYYGAHCANAIVLAGERRVRDAIEAARRCQALNPSHARAYRLLATFHFFLAEPDKTLEYVDHGLRLSPRDFHMASFLLFRGWAHFMSGRDDEALRWMRQAAAASPDSPSILAPLASVLALTGHDEQARETMARYLSLKRTRTRTIAQWNHQPDDNAAFAAFAERFKSGLRRAGMPER